MTTREIVVLIASMISSSGLSAVVVAVIAWRRFGPQDKARTAKLSAETRGIDIETQDKLMAQVDRLLDRVGEQDSKIARLERIIDEQGEQIAILQRRNRDLGAAMRAAVVELLAWIKRALSVMTPDQQTTVGDPPDYQHLINPERSGS